MPPRLDLDEPRDLLELLTTALRTWARHLPVFLVLAALVVVPVEGVLYALDAAGTADSFVASGVLLTQLLVIPALVTAMHVAAVVDLGAGRPPSLARSLGVAARLGPAAILVVAMYCVGVTVGVALVVAPGVFLSVHWYFGAQVVVAEDRRGYGALRRSGEVVGWRWGRAFGTLIVLGGLTAALSAGVGALLDLLLAETDPAEVAEIMVAETAAVSFTSLAGTLLFFDLRARKRHDSGSHG